MVSWVKGIPEEKMEDLCNEVLQRIIIPSVYKQAVAEINYHKSKNARICYPVFFIETDMYWDSSKT
jgi:phosphoserine phosphatase